MSLTVDVLPFEPLPVVRAVVAVGASVSWRLTGQAGESEWLAGEGVGPAVFADPWAPLGVPATYTLTAGSGGPWVSGPALRSFRGDDVVTDLSGRTVAGFRRAADGDPWAPEPRSSFVDVPGSAYGAFAADPVAGRGGGELTAWTTGADTRTLRRLVDANRPLIVLHNKARCRVECDTDAVSTVLLTGAPAERRGRTDVAERSWGLSFRHVPRPYRFLAPVVTWADVLEHWETAADLAASGLSNAALLRGDWAVDW